MINTWKALNRKRQKEQPVDEMKVLVNLIGEVYKRYWNPWLQCNRWKLTVSDDFREAVRKRFPWDPNPIMSMICKRINREDNFISLYRYGKADINSGCVLSYNLGWNNYYYMVLWDVNIDYNEARVIYWYPTLINKLFVNWEYEKLKKSIDLFCKTLTKKE